MRSTEPRAVPPPENWEALQAATANARLSPSQPLDRGVSLRMLAESYSTESMLEVERDMLLARIADATRGDASAAGTGAAAGQQRDRQGSVGVRAGAVQAGVPPESAESLVERLVNRLVKVQRLIQEAEKAEKASPERVRSPSRKALAIAPLPGLQPQLTDQEVAPATVSGAAGSAGQPVASKPPGATALSMALSHSRSAPAGLLSAALAVQEAFGAGGGAQRRPARRKDAGTRLADRLEALDAEYQQAIETSLQSFRKPPRGAGGRTLLRRGTSTVFMADGTGCGAGAGSGGGGGGGGGRSFGADADEPAPTPRREAVASWLSSVTTVDRDRNERGDRAFERRKKGREKLLREARELASRQLEQISLSSWGPSPPSLPPTHGGAGGTGGTGSCSSISSVGSSASSGALPRVLSVGAVRQGGGL